MKIIPLLAITCLLCILSTFASAKEPISFLGISIGMSIPDIQKILERRGYKCFGGDPVGECNKSKEHEITIYGSKAGVDEIMFGCESFNVCNYPKEQYIKLLSNRMNINLHPIPTGLFDRDYCGIGPAGEKICVKYNNTTIIEKGDYGKSAPSFD